MTNEFTPPTRKFDLDLAKGQLAENQLADILKNAKLEVKAEQGLWQRTGNIAIEYKYKGQPSGISTTPADYWAHLLYNSSEEMICGLILPTDKLKRISREFLRAGSTTRGGDGKASDMVLIDLRQLMTFLEGL